MHKNTDLNFYTHTPIGILHATIIPFRTFVNFSRLRKAREPIDGFCKIPDGSFDITVLDAFAHTMIQMSLKDDLADFVQGAFGRIDLNKDVLARYILVDHLVDGIALTDDLFETTMEIVGIHALAHMRYLFEKNK